VRADVSEVRRRRDELAFDDGVVRILDAWARACADIGLRRRIMSVLLWASGWPTAFAAEAFRCHQTTVQRTLSRYREHGPPGLVDRRSDNGAEKVDEEYLRILWEVVGKSPLDFGEARPTWTQELLVKVMARKTRTRIATSTMSRALARIGARLGRPKPFVGCPWPARKRRSRIAEIRRMIRNMPDDEVAFWSDEVDVHLNPKIGSDWMLPGQQKLVETPGKNTKRYIAGAMHAESRKMVWVTGKRKTSALFIELLWKLASQYRRCRVINLIVDNYIIHKSKITQKAVAAFGGKVRLHFLPPYCPDDNPIERVWEDFHANVTRNHRYKTISGLMHRAVRYLTGRNARLSAKLTIVRSARAA